MKAKLGKNFFFEKPMNRKNYQAVSTKGHFTVKNAFLPLLEKIYKVFTYRMSILILQCLVELSWREISFCKLCRLGDIDKYAA